jgi:predicted ATPase
MIGLAEATEGAEAGAGAVQALFEALTQRQPLVLVFDDIHWGMPTFLDLIEHLVDWLRDVPFLLICLARPELLEVRPEWGGGKPNTTSILLEPLSGEECAELVENLASSALDEAARRRIVEASEGNPLFVEEMFALALEGGGGDGEIVVPPTIQALLAARLDRLGEAERAVLDVAAVQGKVFNEEAITALLGPPLLAQAASALGSAVQKELIRPDPPILGRRTYRFRHLLIRDAAYDSIPKEARADLHERFARWLEGAAGDRTTEYEEIVGYHLEQAYRYRAQLGEVDGEALTIAREAAERLGSAAQRALVRSDAPAGINLISRAVALLPADDPRRVDLIPNVRVVQGFAADFGWAERALTEAVEAAATTGDRSFAAHALVQRGFLRLFTEADASVEELIDVAERAVTVFAETGDDLGLARAWRLKAQAHYLGRCAELSADASERALEHARAAGDRFEQREIEEWLVISLVWGPLPVAAALDRCNRLLAAVVGQQERASLILGALALLTTMSGQIDESRKLAAAARRAMEELGEGVWIVSFHLAEASLARGEAAVAEEELRPVYDALKTIGEKSHFSAIAQLLAEAAYRQGRLDEAEQLTKDCEDAARANDVHDQIRWRAVRAQVLASRGEPQAAETLAHEAVALAIEGDFLVARAGALMDLAEVLCLSERRDAAIAAAQEAIRYHELKGNLLGAARASAWLGELGV